MNHLNSASQCLSYTSLIYLVRLIIIELETAVSWNAPEETLGTCPVTWGFMCFLGEGGPLHMPPFTAEGVDSMASSGTLVASCRRRGASPMWYPPIFSKLYRLLNQMYQFDNLIHRICRSQTFLWLLENQVSHAVMMLLCLGMDEKRLEASNLPTFWGHHA